MNTYLGCVTSTDSRGSGPIAGRHRPTPHSTTLAATLDRLSSTSAAANTHVGSRMQGRTNSFDAMQTVVLTRSQLDKPWGFRIQGGQDYNLQLTVKKTNDYLPNIHVNNRDEEKGADVRLFDGGILCFRLMELRLCESTSNS
ncbi:hypothetical protein TSMEX_007932 [Taenia solium]|eukprot:TsM_000761700 transcript=TsM_000761700 gene=TsM_000761700